VVGGGLVVLRVLGSISHLPDEKSRGEWWC
jgi:hypothetical protein